MLTVVTGGSGSGKSEYAEQLILKKTLDKTKPLYYIATMQPFGEEGERRIARHRKQRQGRGFITIEQYARIEAVGISHGANVLLECMSNLVANEMFEENKGRSAEKICQDILMGVGKLNLRCENLVIVTNEVFSDGNSYDKETEEYIRCLGMINRSLAQMADRVVEVVYSIPVVLKGTMEMED